MENTEPICLTRDVECIQIPSGQKATLVTGTEVSLVQSLGGSFTVAARGGLFRVTAQDADALGLEVPTESISQQTLEGSIEDRVWAALKTCFDPEIPVNIVDLGLIYSMTVDEQNRVAVKMTLTVWHGARHCRRCQK